MTDETMTGPAPGNKQVSIGQTMLAVIQAPARFFREMPREGGFGQPLLFLLVMVFASTIIRFIVDAVTGARTFGFGGYLGTLIVGLALTAALGFVVAAILFLIWKLMGSQRPYETAYRCMAYAAAISPVTAVLGAIPYAGAVVSILWMTFLYVTASVEAHGVKRRTAWLVFGIIGLIFILAAIGSERKARDLRRAAAEWKFGITEESGEMTPQEAGQAMGSFMKAMQEEMARQQAEGAGDRR